MEPRIILIALTVAGAISVAILGWVESGESFDKRKFAGSIIRAIIGGFASALIFQGTENPTTWIYVSAFLIGAGIDVSGHRLIGAINQIRE